MARLPPLTPSTIFDACNSSSSAFAAFTPTLHFTEWWKLSPDCVKFLSFFFWFYSVCHYFLIAIYSSDTLHAINYLHFYFLSVFLPILYVAAWLPACQLLKFSMLFTMSSQFGMRHGWGAIARICRNGYFFCNWQISLVENVVAVPFFFACIFFSHISLNIGTMCTLLQPLC